MEEELKENPQVEEEEQPEASTQESDVVSKDEEVKNQPDDKFAIEKETNESRPYDEVIEEARQQINKAYSKQRRTSNIVMIAVVAGLIGGFVMILQKAMGFTIAGYSLIGALVVFMVIYYFVTKNRLPNKIKDYIFLVTNALNAHVFKDGVYSELTSDPADRAELGELLAEGVYEGATNITSRNVVEGLYGGRHFNVADVALRKGQGKQMVNMFIGKHVSYPNNLHFEGRYVILHKRVGAETDIPNAINDLTILSEEEGFVVYGPKDAKINKDTNSKFVSLIKDIKVEDELLNLVIVIWAGHSAAYLSYSDAIIALPFEKPFNNEPFEQYTSQQLQLLNALKTLL